MLPLLVSLAAAASLDNLEIGGPWGSPTATDGNAGWWNPAGFAVGKGTRLDLEVAFESAEITFDRADPNGGMDTYQLSGFPPTFGVASTLGKVGPGQLGVGGIFALPFIRGGTEVSSPGTGHYHMRDGDSKAMWIGAGVAYDVKNIVSIGFTGALVHSTWAAEVDQDTMPDLRAAILETGGGLVSEEDIAYAENAEDPNYMATLDFGGASGGLGGKGELTADTFSFSAGILVHPNERFAIGVTYIHNAVIENTGEVTIKFGCPPTEDAYGRYAAESHGLCDATINGDGYIGYTLPRRVHGGVMFKPVDPLRLELMGGWVRWSEYSDFHIKVSNTDVEAATEDMTTQAKDLIEQERDWARANEDSFWGALDAKVKLPRRFTVGARYWFDYHAVPDEALSTNNWDGDSHIISGLVAYKPVKFLEVSVSYTHHFVDTRTIDNSGFSNPLDMSTADRWRYPHANGTYAGGIDRVALQLRGRFGSKAHEEADKK